MKNLMSISLLMLLSVSTSSSAGSLNGSSWTPSGCGGKPEAPTIVGDSIDTYNQSVAAINDWQQKSKAYFECLINEANKDNNIIANSANQEQAKYRETAEALSKEAAAVSQKLNEN